MNEKIEYWDCDDNAEILYHEDMDEAIEDHLEGQIDKNDPDVLEVYGYARAVVDPAIFKKVILEAAYDYLSENFDNEDGHDQTTEIEEAAGLFVNTYLENYTTWMCNQVKTEKVNVKEWIQKNRPEWAETREAKA
jgi:hypothetical protein